MAGWEAGRADEADASGGRWRAALLFAAGLAAGLLPLAVFQWLTLGDPVGFHLTHGFAVGPDGGLVSRLSGHVGERWLVLYHMLFAWALDVRLSVLLSLPLLLLWRPALPRRSWEAAIVACALWGLAKAVRERPEEIVVTTSIRRPLEPGATVVDDAGLGFFSQQLVPHRL